MGEKVIVGMSGGVDSSVAALLLLQKGFEVEGLSLILTPDDDGAAVRDARAVADKIGIPLHVEDKREEFKEKVIDYFVEEYKNGRTPNPCVVCNEHIKFGLMLSAARALGAGKLATGHYAKLQSDGDKVLLKMADSEKDQSYFLYRVSNENFEHVMFPMAEFEKVDTRAIAKENGLPVAEKDDSQEICFIKDNDYVKFIKDYSNYTPKPGNFVNLQGEVIGQHAGIINFTVGQRKGLGMAFGEPMFVTKIDAKTNDVILAPNGFQETKEFFVDNLKFQGEPIAEEKKLLVKIRYKAKPTLATAIPIGDSIKVVFDEPQRAVTPGQSAVLYDGDIVVGGGFIRG